MINSFKKMEEKNMSIIVNLNSEIEYASVKEHSFRLVTGSYNTLIVEPDGGQSEVNPEDVKEIINHNDISIVELVSVEPVKIDNISKISCSYHNGVYSLNIVTRKWFDSVIRG